MLSLDTFQMITVALLYYSSALFYHQITPPLIELCQCQSNAWMKKEGDANGLCDHTVVVKQ